MIERVSNQRIHLNPSLSLEKRPTETGVEIKHSAFDTADYLYNPQFVEKLDMSRQSISEELMLLQDQKSERGRSGSQRDRAKSDTQADSIESLKRNLVRMKFLLLQVASVAAADPDSLETIQKNLADELRGYERAMKDVDIVEFKRAKIADAATTIREFTTAEGVERGSVVNALNAVESAQAAVEVSLRQTNRDAAGRVSETEAALQTADQNLAAAEAGVYPGDIFERAKAVARRLTAVDSVATIHHSLMPGEVLGLLDPDQ